MLSTIPAGPYWIIVRRGDEEPVLVCDTLQEAVDALESLR